jgi:hypothetical protein
MRSEFTCTRARLRISLVYTKPIQQEQTIVDRHRTNTSTAQIHLPGMTFFPELGTTTVLLPQMQNLGSISIRTISVVYLQVVFF